MFVEWLVVQVIGLVLGALKAFALGAGAVLGVRAALRGFKL